MTNGEIYRLIPEIMKAIGAVGKEGTNKQQGYKFRSIEDVMNAAHPVLATHGVFCAPEVISHESQDRQSFNREGEAKTSIRVSALIRHTFWASDGSSVPVVTLGEGIDSFDKASNKAMSFAYKYAMCELFCIPTEDFAEGDKDSPPAGAKANGQPVVPVTEKDIPLQRTLPPADLMLTKEHKATLNKRFREELHASLRANAEEYLHDLCGVKDYLDENGNPSIDAIPEADYIAFGKEAVEFAHSLKPLPKRDRHE